MKKLTTKLLMSIIAVAFAFVALGTSTYAWFSMNTTVQATGINIQAKSSTTYLLVSNANKTAEAQNVTAVSIQGENQGKGYTDIDLSTTANTELFPVALGTVGAADTYTVTPIVPGAGVTSLSWYTMIGQDAATATGKTGSARSVASADYNKYFLTYRLFFTLAEGSQDATDLHVSAITIDGDSAVRCVVVGESNSVQFAASDEDGDAMVLAATLTSSAVKYVDVYVFYEGNQTNINTNNRANIADTTVSLTFAVTLPNNQ